MASAGSTVPTSGGAVTEAMEPTVMKVSCGEQLHRVLLPAEPDFASVEAAIQRLASGPGIATFVGTKGAPRVLSEATFDELLATAYVGPTGRPTLRLDLQPPLAVGLQPVATMTSQTEGACSGESGKRRDKVSRKGERRSGKSSKSSSGSSSKAPWQQDTRAIDDLVDDIGGEPFSRQATGRTEKSYKKKSRRKKAQEGSSGMCSVQEESPEDLHCEGEEGAADAPAIALGVEQAKAVDVVESIGSLTQGALWDVAAAKYEEGQAVDDVMASISTQDSRHSLEECLSLDDAPSGTFSTAALDVQQPSPTTLWDATPESTPPTSPRHCRSQFQAVGPPQAVFWMPVPVWMTQ